MNKPFFYTIAIIILLTGISSKGNCQSQMTMTTMKKNVEITLSGSGEVNIDKEDTSVNEYLTDKLKPIKENFKRINAIKNWTSIDTQKLWETTEGGEAKFYYQKGQLEKIVTYHFGETFQAVTEYYLLDEQLSFVFRKLELYNRPFYYDLAMMKENNDNEMYDSEKSEIIEDRCYFENGKLIHHIKKQSGGKSPFYDNSYDEKEGIITDFEKLIGNTKN